MLIDTHIKFLFISLICLSLSISGSAKKRPVLVLEKEVVECGKFDKEKPQVFELNFRNKGNANLVINRIETDCSCTKVEYPQDIIPKGGKGKILIKLDMNYLFYHQSFVKYITIMCNDKKSTYRVKVTGSVL